MLRRSKSLNIFSGPEPTIMDNDNQAPAARGGRPPGAINYQNNVLIAIVEQLLPQGLEGWREVALEYQRQTSKAVLRRGEDVRDNWVKKLCKNMKKPTGKPGEMDNFLGSPTDAQLH